MEQPGRLVEDGDVDDLRVEDLLDTIAYELVHRLHVEVHRQASLHVVDQREFGVALTGVVDQPCPLERRGDVVADELQELFLGLRVFLVLQIALDHDRADRLAFGLQRDADPAHRLLADQLDLAACHHPPPVGCREQHRPARAQEVGGRAGGVADPERLPHVRIRDVRVDRVDEVREVDHPALVVVESDVEVVRVHEFADDRVDLPIEVLHVLGGARRLGDPVQGVLDLLGALASRLVGLELGDPLLEGSDLVVEGGHAGSSTSRAQSLIATLRPRISNSPSSTASDGGSRRASFVCSENNTACSSSFVMASMRDAVLVVSPITAYSRRLGEPTLPESTGPELIPIPMRSGCSTPEAPSHALNVASCSPAIARAAASARSAWSSLAIGAPNAAMMPSPM